MKGLEIEFLGTGTSTGVPQIKCSCQVCCSDDARDKRLRSSVIVRYKGKNLLIDCGPDFRTQILNASNNNLDALLISHIHYDHVGGIDDLRAYCSPEKPFRTKIQLVRAAHSCASTHAATHLNHQNFWRIRQFNRIFRCVRLARSCSRKTVRPKIRLSA